MQDLGSGVLPCNQNLLKVAFLLQWSIYIQGLIEWTILLLRYDDKNYCTESSILIIWRELRAEYSRLKDKKEREILIYCFMQRRHFIMFGFFAEMTH